MFAMMRALGFRLNHIIGFVTLQAFTFSIPGMLFGIVIAFVLNVGYRVVYYTLFDNFASYELTWFSIATGTICFGILVPLVSNIGPTRLALGKNLRTSLDVTRKSAVTDEVSVTFKRIKDVSFSFNEVALGISLTFLGFVVYVFIPQALIQERMIEFFLIPVSYTHLTLPTT